MPTYSARLVIRGVGETFTMIFIVDFWTLSYRHTGSVHRVQSSQLQFEVNELSLDWDLKLLKATEIC